MSLFSSNPKLDGRHTIPVDDPGSPAAPQNAPIAVSGKWIAWGVALTIVAAVICGWLALCLLFYQGQWQMVLHPEPMRAVPAGTMPPYQEVRFDPGDSGQTQLFGWWIPAAAASPYANETLVYMPDGSGSLSGRTRTLSRLHDLGRNVFTFDYRGFGNSAKMHPSQASMQEDAVAAISYLTETRHVPPSKIAIYGSGSGAVAAAYAATQQQAICCLVLDNARPDLLSVFQADSRTRMIPMRMLLRDEFNLMPLVEQSQQPKLIFASSGTKTDSGYAHSVFAAASGKKTFADLYSLDAESKAQVAVRDFLDQNLKP